MTANNPQRGPSLPVVVLCALGIFAGLAAYLRLQESGLVLSAQSGGPPGKPPPQVAAVEQAVSAMQLVTIVLDTHVVVNARDESTWRGDVDATLKVPVRLLYGTDFSRAKVDSVKLGPLATAYLVRVPDPARIATEVYPEREESQVRTGWLRFRAVGGEYTLGLARRSIGEEARRMVLTRADQEMIRDRTRERVIELVKAVAGPSASVTVAFDQAGSPPDHAAAE